MRKVLVSALVVAVLGLGLGLSSVQAVRADSAALVGVNTTTGVYSSPSLKADVIGTLFAGQTWFVNGTDSTGKWVQVQLGPNAQGWVPATTLGLQGVTLPVFSGITGDTTAVSTTTGSTASSGTSAASTSSATSTSSTSSTAKTVVSVPYLVGVNTTTPVYTLPSTAANSYVIGQLLAGQTWFVLGVDPTGKWVQVEIIRGNVSGWVAASALGLNGAILPTVTG